MILVKYFKVLFSVGGSIHHLGPDMAEERCKLEGLKEKDVSQSASCENLNKVNNDPESPTSAIDADEIIMRSRGNCGQAAENKSATGNSQSAEKSFSLRSLHNQVNKLKLPKKSPQLTQTPEATTTATPHSENVVSEALALPLEVDPPFLPPTHRRSLATRPRPASFPLAKSALAPETGGQVVPPPRSLDDNNFLLLAECARVVRDTIALRGVQVCAQQTPISGSFADFQGAPWADKSIGRNGSFGKV